MELILKSDNRESIEKIIALAKKLDLDFELKPIRPKDSHLEDLRNRIMNFKATSPSPFGDAESWQRDEREDRNLPFS
jgi:hypothetical protein